ncbi:hypothetical protein GIB67_029082 [Kingdonia uniflora]|uniref:Protein kinase domain-containing protein n=1 Tax=Kingdonia uniflora TaxID=39325 RepID=A0A7J7N6U8_9MAGN|nr:hypothetical protein GIB67_029082 [Kingdonia uniflora]
MGSQMASSSSTYSNLSAVARLPREFFYEDLKKATKNFRDKIGSGGSGSVFKGILKDGTPVAVKRVERLISGRASFIVYDLLPNGSLDTWIFTRMTGGGTGRCLSWSWRMKVATEVATAIAYLHHDCHPRILHLDIKPENIFLHKGFQAIVSDLGMSQLMIEDKSRVQTIILSTNEYMPLSSSRAEGSQRIVMLIVTEWEILKLIDKRLMANKVDEKEVRLLLVVALACLEEDPEKRFGMLQVLNYLENYKGLIEGIYNVGAKLATPVNKLEKKFCGLFR